MSANLRRGWLGNALARNWPDKVPAWSLIAFGIVYTAAFAPCVFFVVGIHNDYEMIWYKEWGVFHIEAASLAAIGRPVAALLSNLTVLPAMKLADFMWTRLFSIATVWLLGAQLIIICVCHLAIKPRHASIIVLGIFLVPAFLYSVLAAAAWAPHLVSIFFAFWAYGILSRSNVQTTPLIDLARRRDFRGLMHQALIYVRMKQVLIACGVLQLGLYDYPPQAMILTCLPIAALLFSTHPPAYRILLALRDVVFLGANVVIYAVTAKLIYIPIVRAFVFRYSDAWYASGDRTNFDMRIADSYRYSFNYDPVEVFKRLANVARVAGDLWFLPQSAAHFYVAALIIVVALIVVAWRLRWSKSAALGELDGLRRLSIESWHSHGTWVIVTIVACFVLASSAVLGSGGGFVTYRTIAMPIAVVCVVALFSVRLLGELAGAIAHTTRKRRSQIGDLIATVLIVAAVGATFYNNYLTMRLGRNEHAYFAGMLRQALSQSTRALVLVDPRPFNLPEDNPVVFDQKGRWVPPYEMGCFSGYCLQTEAIFRVVGAELGIDPRQFWVATIRGNDPGPGISCDLLRAPAVKYPEGATEKTRKLIRNIREAPSFICFTYDLKWHDVGLDLEAQMPPLKKM